jgi:nucleoside-diphosphate-sugar epimerase
MIMKVFMIGGTGLLGSEAAKELINRGHSVSSIALPPVPTGSSIPKEMELSFGNYMEMTDDYIRKQMTGCDGFVFAAGVDERVEGPAPIYDMFFKYNIAPVKRLLTIAKECGVKNVVILGSYFAYCARIHPEWGLTKVHPYIRSRVDQENMAISFATDGINVAVLELPYIFGAQPGRKPVWMFLVEQIRSIKFATLYPKGGTTMVTIKQVAQSIAGALERNRGGKAYPIGYYNMMWKEMLRIVHKHMGFPNKRIITIPTWVYTMAANDLMKKQKAKNIDGGLNMIEFAKIMTSNLFIKKEQGAEELGVQPDDIDTAIGDSIKLCLAILDKKTEAIGMKGE